jgi:hypothetical protein
MMMKRFKTLALMVLTVWFASAAFSSAHATVITHTVLGTDNLYNTAWFGNPFPGAIGTPGATDARSVQDGGVGFDFSPFGSVLQIATGSVVDAGSTATDADGLEWLFRGLPVYSLIGIWSSTDTSITAIGSAFFVGTSATIIVPTAMPAYLFLAENDGIFSDNSGSYRVTLTVVAVPEPGTLCLLGLGLLGMGAARRRRKA